MCLIIPKIFQRLFGNCRQGSGRFRKRPETFLTPYEIDMIPLMLKELDLVNKRFYQMVCYRWFQEGQLVQKSLRPINEIENNENLLSTSNNFSNQFTFEDFLSEGQALKQLICQLSRSLMEKGTFDEECEDLIIRYRMERQEWQGYCQDVNFPNNDLINDSLRSPSCSIIPTNNTRYLNCPRIITTASSPSWCSNSTCSYSTTSTTTLSNHLKCGLSDTRSLLTTPQPNGDLNASSDNETDIEEKNPKIIQRHCQFASEKVTTLKLKKKKQNSKKFFSLRNRTTSTKERKQAANYVDALFVQLGEILIHQFHSTITVDNCKQNLESNILLPAITGNKPKKSGRNTNENVHERELKVLIWRRFVQMLVTMLTDKVRFPL